jgi:hypothetical protein
VDHVRDKCGKYIGERLEPGRFDVGANEAMFYFWLCEQYELKELRQKAINCAADKYTRDLIQSEHFKRYPRNGAMDILIARCFKLSKHTG